MRAFFKKKFAASTSFALVSLSRHSEIDQLDQPLADSQFPSPNQPDLHCSAWSSTKRQLTRAPVFPQGYSVPAMQTKACCIEIVEDQHRPTRFQPAHSACTSPVTGVIEPPWSAWRSDRGQAGRPKYPSCTPVVGPSKHNLLVLLAGSRKCQQCCVDGQPSRKPS